MTLAFQTPQVVHSSTPLSIRSSQTSTPFSRTPISSTDTISVSLLSRLPRSTNANYEPLTVKTSRATMAYDALQRRQRSTRRLSDGLGGKGQWRFAMCGVL
jgi:hypothetical protein